MKTAAPMVSPEGRLSPELALAVVEAASDAILVADTHGRVRFANARTELLFGLTRRALLGRQVEDLIADRPWSGRAEHRADYRWSPQARALGVGFDLWAQQPDGSEVQVQISLSPMDLGGQPATIAVVREVGDYRAAEVAERQVLLAEDEERIAAELHGRVIERLFSAGVGIQAVLHLAGPPLATRLGEAVDELDLAIREIRDAVFDRLSRRP
ncbi:MAG TPA: PAS domain S-box protein [Acidimicrobiales bacterium]|nr:PAS domain S-box protein [Acidimicrobiales bacterium]